MREIRLSGSEGGGTQINEFSLPLSCGERNRRAAGVSRLTVQNAPELSATGVIARGESSRDSLSGLTPTARLRRAEKNKGERPA